MSQLKMDLHDSLMNLSRC